MPTESRQIPLTIGPTTEYGWLGGTALNEYVGRKSSYSTQSDGGIDPFRKPGILQAGFVASNVNSFITTQINALQTYSASGSLLLYGYDIVGRVFRIDTANHSNVSVMASLTDVNSDTAFAINRDYLFAMGNNASLQAFLYRMGPLTTGVLATTLNASMVATVNGLSIKHILLPWKSNLYCLHANNVDYLDGNGVTSGVLTVGARLPSSMVQKCACPYGDRLAIGASDNLGSSSNRGSNCKVYFYDGISNDWQQEVNFPENDILNIAYEFGELLAWGVKWLYKYNPSAGGFEPIELLDTSAPTFSRAHGINDGQFWFTSSNTVRSYGSPVRYLDRVMNVPYGAVGTGGVCKWVNNNRLYVSNSAGNLLYLSAAAGSSTRWRSRVIEVNGTKYRVAWLRVVTETLATNDGLTAEWIDKNGNSYSLGSMTYSADGAILSKEFFAKDFGAEPPYLTEGQLSLLFDTGNVKVRRVDMILETASEY
jgi:hypothetical protein